MVCCNFVTIGVKGVNVSCVCINEGNSHQHLHPDMSSLKLGLNTLKQMEAVFMKATFLTALYTDLSTY